MRVFVGGWVGGDEFGAGVGEEFFEGGDAFFPGDEGGMLDGVKNAHFDEIRTRETS